MQANDRVQRKAIDLIAGGGQRILFMAPSAYRLGGVQNWLSYLLPGLADSGFDVHFGLVEGRLHDPTAYLEMHPFSPAHRVLPRDFTPIDRQNAIASFVESIDPDILVGVNIVDVYPAAMRLFRNKDHKCRVVATQHALQMDYYEDFRNFAPVIDAVVCTNRLSAKLCNTLSGIPDNRVMYAPYGVDLSPVAPRSNRKRLVIGYAGRLSNDQKRIMDLPAICSKLKRDEVDFEFLIAGDGPQRAQLCVELERDELAPYFTWLGHIPSDRLPKEFYQKIDVLLITSEWETGPIVAWEAMANGVCVVTSDYVGRYAEGRLIDGVNCRVFPVGDQIAAARAIVSLMDSQVRDRIASDGRDLVEREYSKPRSIESWAQVMLEIARMVPVDKGNAIISPPLRGRLDKYLGAHMASHVRGLIGRKAVPQAPGDEWPHSYGTSDNTAFWKIARVENGLVGEARRY